MHVAIMYTHNLVIAMYSMHVITHAQPIFHHAFMLLIGRYME